MYSLFNILHTYNQCYNLCLPVELSLCIASLALNFELCVHRARMGAQSSPGRVLGNLAPRERIGQSYPAGKDARLIHPCRMEQIDSVKINPSLIMMRECAFSFYSLIYRIKKQVHISFASGFYRPEPLVKARGRRNYVLEL